jgi:RsiW-degrading membrane proteinase PrsW (M82 family)
MDSYRGTLVGQLMEILIGMTANPEDVRPQVGTTSTALPFSRESRGERSFFFLSGIMVGVPVALFFESVSHLYFTSLGVATIIAPLVEEFAKADPLFFRYERSARSLMRFGLLSGLGFGVAEFLVYIYGGAPFFVRLPAIAFHAAGASIVGYGVSNHRTLRYYSLAVVLHFLNNFFAALGWLWLVGGVGATVASYYLAWKFYRQSSKHN